MTKYYVSSLDSDYGVFEAESAGEAKDKCARRWGYVDEFDMRKELGDSDGKLLASEVKKRRGEYE